MKREDITKDALLCTALMGIPSGGLLFFTLINFDVSFEVSSMLTFFYLLSLFLKQRQDNIIDYLKDKP